MLSYRRETALQGALVLDKNRIWNWETKSGQIFLPFCHKSRVWQTDGRTDKRTEFSSLDRVCIPCSAIKRHNQAHVRDPLEQQPVDSLSSLLSVTNCDVMFQRLLNKDRTRSGDSVESGLYDIWSSKNREDDWTRDVRTQRVACTTFVVRWWSKCLACWKYRPHPARIDSTVRILLTTTSHSCNPRCRWTSILALISAYSFRGTGPGPLFRRSAIRVRVRVRGYRVKIPYVWNSGPKE